MLSRRFETVLSTTLHNVWIPSLNVRNVFVNMLEPNKQQTFNELQSTDVRTNNHVRCNKQHKTPRQVMKQK